MENSEKFWREKGIRVSTGLWMECERIVETRGLWFLSTTDVERKG